MPTFINDLPLHVLVVHAVVVLVPLAVLGSIAVVAFPSARRRYGWLVVGLAAVATVFIPVATSSGEGLEHRLPRTALLETHTHLGDQLLIFVAGMLVMVAAFVFLHHRNRAAVGAQADVRVRGHARADGPGTTAAPATLSGGRRTAAVVLAALTVVLGVISAVQVYRIGDSGARAAWSDTQYVTPTPGEGPADGG